jgi:transposase InsO family protein
MRQYHPSYSLDALCRLFGRSRQAYYARTNYVSVKNLQKNVILSLVRETRKDFPRMGVRKLLVYLRPKFETMGLHIGRDAFFELLYQNFMLVRRFRNKRKTSFSDHWMRKYPNLIVGYTPDAPNRLWVSDITYIELDGGSAYLCLITDAFSHKIVGWHLGQTLRSSNTLAALKMVLKNLRGNQPWLIHHSDIGSQYCCGSYVNALTCRKIQISMTQNGDPCENAIAERVNGILKTEWIYDKKPSSWQKTVDFVSKIIDLYNHQRPHLSIGYMVPAHVHQTGMKAERMWKNYYRKKDVYEEGNVAENGHNRTYYNGETKRRRSRSEFPHYDTDNQHLKQLSENNNEKS